MHATAPASTDLAFTPVTELARLLRDGTVTAPQLAEIYLERIGRSELNAYREVRAEGAREDAAAAQARLDRGAASPLLGIPIAVKDVAGLDAPAVARLRQAGAVVLGTTNLPELAAFGHFTASEQHGVTRNPFDPERSPGGSSGGSAVAVAAGLAAAALGTDGGGSIRLPAGMCGLVGLKPQRGRVPLAREHWHGLTVCGPIARTAADAALLYDVLAGTTTPLDAPRALRIGVAARPALPPAPVGKERRAALASTAALLRELGHEVVEVRPRYGAVGPAFTPRWLGGIAQDAAEHGAVERRTRALARLGRRIGGRAQKAEDRLVARLAPLFADVDVLLTPLVAKAPPRADQRGGAVRTFFSGAPYVAWTPPWNVTGQPALALPAGFDDAGLPLAVQLVGRPDGEATLLALAAGLEGARPRATGRT